MNTPNESPGDQVAAPGAAIADPGAAAPDLAGSGSPGSPQEGGAAPGEAPIVPGQAGAMEVPESIVDPGPRKRGRPSKADLEARARLNSVTQAAPRPAPPPPSAPAPLPVNYDAMAQTAANLWFNVPCLVFGDEWAPDKDEVPVVHRAFRDYFEAAKIPAIPPAWGLGLVLVTYAAKRTQRPTIRERIYSGVSWVRAKLKL